MKDSDSAFVSHLERVEGLHDVVEVGRGAMGVVYSAVDNQLGRKVAVKRLTFDLLSDDESERRFRQEMRKQAGFRHDAIIRIFSGRVAEGVDPYFIMEFVEGTNLREEIARRREGGDHFTIEETCRVLRPIASALDYIHGLASPIIHRDVKPANILRPTDRSGAESILADFGISRSLDETMTGSFLGTVTYSAPESFVSADNPDPSVDPTALSDNYALALIAFEMLTLHQLAKLMSEAQWRGSRPTPSIGAEALNSADADSAEAVTAVFSRGLANLPRDRFGTCVEFIDALEAAGRHSKNSWIVPEVRIGAGGTVDATRPVREGERYAATTRTSRQQIQSGEDFDPTAGLRAPKRRKALLVGGIGALVAVGAGVFAFFEYVAWPSGQRTIASAFPSAISQTRIGSEHWQLGGVPEAMACDPVRWGEQDAIRCIPEGRPDSQALFVDFGSEQQRNEGVTLMLPDDSDWEDRTLRAEGAGCTVGVLTTQAGDDEATLILPDSERANFLVLVTGDSAHTDWKTLPICR